MTQKEKRKGKKENEDPNSDYQNLSFPLYFYIPNSTHPTKANAYFEGILHPLRNDLVEQVSEFCGVEVHCLQYTMRKIYEKRLLNGHVDTDTVALAYAPGSQGIGEAIHVQ